MHDLLDSDEQFQVNTHKLIRAIKQEVLNPEVLPFEKEMYSYMFKSVKEQEEKIRHMVEPTLEGGDMSSHQKNLKQLIYKCETEKIEYLLKQYLRIRLKKIQTYCFYLYKNQSLAERRLSENEQAFMREYAECKFKYFEDNVNKHIPRAYRGLGGLESFFLRSNEIKPQIDTKQSRIEIKEPAQDTYVYCNILANPDMYRFASDIPLGKNEDTSVIPINSTIFTQYKYVSKLVADSNAQLI